MIVFLTLLYVGLLAVLIKVGIIKLNLWWKLSPVVWMLLLFVILFLPMQWGAPGGSVTVLKFVVEIVPNVTGEVVEVPVQPLQLVERDDVLFQIDPEPYQAKVNELDAQLAATIQNVEMLEAAADAADSNVKRTEEQIDVRKKEIEVADADVDIAAANVEQAQTNLSKVATQVSNLEVQVAASLREYERRKGLAETGAVSQSEVDQIEVQYTGLLSQLNDAQANLQAAEQSLTSSRAALVGKKAELNTVELQLKQLIEAEVPAARSLAKEARLAAESMIGDEHTSVAEVRAKLASAEYDLRETTVRAPAKGYVAYLSLRPGQRVASLPMRSWMAFVDEEQTEIVAMIPQYTLRYVRPGQTAELTFKLYPGRVFAATVDRIVDINSSAQLSPSGQLAQISGDESAQPYGVALRIDDDSVDMMRLAGGAKGTAAIYTESMKATHIIRRVMIRMDAWMNYILP